MRSKIWHWNKDRCEESGWHEFTTVCCRAMKKRNLLDSHPYNWWWFYEVWSTKEYKGRIEEQLWSWRVLSVWKVVMTKAKTDKARQQPIRSVSHCCNETLWYLPPPKWIRWESRNFPRHDMRLHLYPSFLLVFFSTHSRLHWFLSCY